MLVTKTDQYNNWHFFNTSLRQRSALSSWQNYLRRAGIIELWSWNSFSWEICWVEGRETWILSSGLLQCLDMVFSSCWSSISSPPATGASVAPCLTTLTRVCSPSPCLPTPITRSSPTPAAMADRHLATVPPLSNVSTEGKENNTSWLIGQLKVLSFYS